MSKQTKPKTPKNGEKKNKLAKPELLKTFQERGLNEMMHFIKSACTYFAVLAVIIVPASGL